MKLRRSILSTAVLAASVATGSALAQQLNPYMQPDDTWISLTGTVQDVTRDSFNLDYGTGTVIVEMDDGDRDADAYKLIEGDYVTVSGRIDDDFFETTSIEASSVYVPKLNTFFYASAVDEEDFSGWYNLDLPAGEVIAQGTVTEVGEHEFTINRHSQSLEVSTTFMENNPLDDEGYHRIAVGDVVRVSGEMEFGFMSEAELEADSVITLIDRS